MNRQARSLNALIAGPLVKFQGSRNKRLARMEENKVKKKNWNIAGIAIIAAVSLFMMWHLSFLRQGDGRPAADSPGNKTVQLPAPEHKGETSLEEAIFQRRSIRSFRDEPLNTRNVSQLLWAAAGKTVDGVTGATRAYPSAGGIYPIEFYLVAGEVEGLDSGIYLYRWRDHSLKLAREGDFREELMKACLGQRMVYHAPVSIVLAADYPRTVARYGKRGEVRYVPMDVGGAGQNLHLQAETLGLGTVIVGAFNDSAVKEALGGIACEPMYVMPVGRPR